MVDTYVSDAYVLRTCGFKSHLEHQVILCPGDGMVDMTVLEAVAARCKSSSLFLGTIKILKASFIIEWGF